MLTMQAEKLVTALQTAATTATRAGNYDYAKRALTAAGRAHRRLWRRFRATW